MNETSAERSGESSSSSDLGIQARQAEDGSYEFIVDDPTTRAEDRARDTGEATSGARPRRAYLLGAAVITAALVVVVAVALGHADRDGISGAHLEDDGGFVPYDDSGDGVRASERNASAEVSTEHAESARARHADETRPEDLPPENTTGELTGPPGEEPGWDLEEPIDEEIAENDVDESIEDRDAIVEVVPSDISEEEPSDVALEEEDVADSEREEFAEEDAVEIEDEEGELSEPAPDVADSVIVREDLRERMIKRHLGDSRRDLLPRVVEMPRVVEAPGGSRLKRNHSKIETGTEGDERAEPSPY